MNHNRTLRYLSRNGKPAYSSRNFRTLGDPRDSGRWKWQNLQEDWSREPKYFFAIFSDPPSLPSFLAALGGADR